MLDKNDGLCGKCPAPRCRLAIAPVRLRRFRVDPDRIGIIHVSEKNKKGASAKHIYQTHERRLQLFFGLLLQCILGDRLEGLFDVDGLLCRSFEIRYVALRLAPRHCALLRDLFPHIPRTVSPGILRSRWHRMATHLSFALFHVDLIAEDDKGEVLGIVGTRLDQELVSPTVEGLEGL
jgi:hypothetical protein